MSRDPETPDRSLAGPPLLPWARPPVFVPTGKEAATFDRRAIEEIGIPEAALMERAGSQAATWIRLHLLSGSSGPVLVLAGSGNNGGDALVAARCLHLAGVTCRVVHTGSEPADPTLLHGHDLPADRAGDLSDEGLDALIAASELVIDGMLGTGATGAPRGEAGRLVEKLTKLRGTPGAPTVVALDIPTGVEADTGVVEGLALHAEVTLAFGWPKLGSLLHPGRAHVGRLLALEIGFPPAEGAFRWELLTGASLSRHLPRRDPVTHKNRVGALLVVAGREGMAGAAILAGRAALRSGTGFLRVASVGANREAVQSALPEAVWVDRDDPESLAEAIEASEAVATGPGIGTDRAGRTVLSRILEGAARPTVLDADALTLLADGVGLPDDRPLVLTPHPGEAGRLLGSDTGSVQADRLDALERLRERFGAVVLLKGTPSLVAGEGCWVDAHGSSDLAAAGMGDVLTGTVGSFLAQGVDPERAAGVGLVATGLAATRAGKGAGLQTADVPEELPAVLGAPGDRPGFPTAPPPALSFVHLDLPPAR